MHFTYCPHCGSLLGERILGDEGGVPWCETCNIPLFDVFSTCVICAVINREGEVALINEKRYNSDLLVCIAGYMKPGESAEDAAIREIGEEIGQTVERLTFVRSYPMGQRSLLMLGFCAEVDKQPFTLSGEVSAAEWVPFDQALSRIREGSIAWQLVKAVIDERS